VTRRELMLLLCGAMTAPGSARAQQRTMPVIGFLGGTSPSPNAANVSAFRQGLGHCRNRDSPTRQIGTG
jgi:putative ABC transport system substrate-binding protein